MRGCVYVFLCVSVGERDLEDRGKKEKCGGERESLARARGESEREKARQNREREGEREREREKRSLTDRGWQE